MGACLLALRAGMVPGTLGYVKRDLRHTALSNRAAGRWLSGALPKAQALATGTRCVAAWPLADPLGALA
ncbi:hypothetical protein SEA_AVADAKEDAVRA_133 [Mycobacterium phage AvadaKedavra]|uniref:Uncharacterized protein n=1 Tax=Mycobacterium phage AvadaKedavra TaxID=2593344 RepID=A0A514U5E1_9CAUD|nr:hypothetical protein SEA_AVADAKEDAVRA_133 [Mycobacterium phage AvadaKedavra]QGJ92523.1 hypothetical protein SEA_WYATT2_132 [Mycobacterium phage Wyatt2]QOC56785.1 hypothetical protein SEA_TYSON_135 [Mycobacterium phage Tyson]